MKKKLLVFRFEEVLMNFKPGQYYIQKNLWELLKRLKQEGYKLVLITNLGFESFVKAVTSMNEVSEVIHTYFDKLIQSHRYHELDDITKFMEKHKIESNETIYFGRYFNDYQAAQKAKIDFIGVIDHLPETQLLSETLPSQKQIHPVLFEEFLQNYLELTKV